MSKVPLKLKIFNINNIKRNKKIIIVVLFSLFILSLKRNNNTKNEINNIELYRTICEKGFLFYIQKIQHPKISIISAVHNRGKYILRFIKSIQNQFFNDIEIIFIDDFSNDNTIEIIEKIQKMDERVILIKNKKNKGTLISRNNGALKSRGEYLIFPDPDDMLSGDILNYCYLEAKENNYDIIKFVLYNGNKKNMLKEMTNVKNQEILPSKLNSYIFYGNGYLKQTDYSISNKFLKRDIFIKSLNYSK